MKNKVIFLDRDGTLNEDYGYVYKEEDFHFIPGVFEALKKLLNLGYKLIVITNQSGINRGLFNEKDLLNLNKYMINELKKNNISIEKIYYCPHTDADNCECRKPKPGMLIKASKDFNISLENSWMVGDGNNDIKAGKAAGCKTVLVGKSNGDKPDMIVDSLKTAVKKIINLSGIC